jgi:hypothetical protein
MKTKQFVVLGANGGFEIVSEEKYNENPAKVGTIEDKCFRPHIINGRAMAFDSESMIRLGMLLRG